MSNSQDELDALRTQLAGLTGRVARLEKMAGIAPGVPPERAAMPAPPSVPLPATASPAAPPRVEPSTPPPSLALPRFAHLPDRESGELESKIGKLWLNRVGIVAMLVGVSYFIKYAFENQWIGPAGRVALGLVAGIGLILWSERFRSKGYSAFSYSLKAVGIGTLYLSFWGAYQVYHLVPSSVSFVAMIAVTASTIILALTQDAEILAAFAIAGGFSTPVMLSTGQNHEIVLFTYVALLNVATLGMVAYKPWRRLLVGSFVGTVILYIGWFSAYYTEDQRAITVLYIILFGAIFAAIPLLTPLTQSRWHVGFSVTLTLLPLINAAALFLALFVMYERQKITLTWYALALAAVYLALSSQFKRRVESDPQVVRMINLLHIAIAIAFLTIAIPLKLDGHWITLGWLIESAALLYVAVRTSADFLRYFAVATLCLGILRLLAIDNFNVQTLVFNARFATYLVAIAVLAGIVIAGERFAAEHEKPFLRVSAVALNVLALFALTLEASDYFSRELTGWYQTHVQAAYEAYRQMDLARHFSYSAIWLTYGACLMLFGFWKRSAFARWQAMVLIAFTIGKVFIYDASELQQFYRILSFIALGAVLMGISYAYHRDWLKLSQRSEEQPSVRRPE